MRLSFYLVLGYLVNSNPKLVVLFHWAVYDVHGPSIPTSDAEIPILIWLVLVYRSFFDIWTGQNMRKILRRHLLIKTCNCFVILLLAIHVLQPYKRTDFTLKLNRRSFVPMEYTIEFQILSSAPNALRAFCILVAASISVPPLSSIIIPR
jgi:hypothetical protein